MTASEQADLRRLAEAVVRIEGKVESNTLARAEDARLTAIKLDSIETQVNKTNGRVSRLEAWKDRILGGAFVLGVAYSVATDLFGLLAK